jgi:hypothetical protein
MNRDNRKSIYIRRKEGESPMPKDEIVKGLRSKNIPDKTKSMKKLLVNIINDPYYDQMLMTGNSQPKFVLTSSYQQHPSISRQKFDFKKTIDDLLGDC